MDKYKELVTKVAQECLEGLKASNSKSCSLQDKVQRIKECVGMIMDVAPIMPVGQENPAKKEAEEKEKKKKSAK